MEDKPNKKTSYYRSNNEVTEIQNFNILPTNANPLCTEVENTDNYRSNKRIYTKVDVFWPFCCYHYSSKTCSEKILSKVNDFDNYTYAIGHQIQKSQDQTIHIP